MFSKKTLAIAAAFLLMSGASAQKVLDFGFEDNTVGEKSGVVIDKSGFDNDGMLHSITNEGALIVTPGANGTAKAVELHGGDDSISDYDSVVVPNSSTLNITGDLTISAWIKKDVYDIPVFSGIVTKTYNAPAHVEPTKYAEYWLAINKFGQLVFKDNTGIDLRTSASVVKDNEWVYVAVVRDRAKQELKFYVNGKLVETKTGIPAIAGESNDYDVGIGACYPCQYPFKGKIDCVHIYNNALNDNAIENDMNSCNVASTPSDNNDTNVDNNSSCSNNGYKYRYRYHGNNGNNGNNGSVNNNGNSGNNCNSNGSNVGNHNQNGNGSSCANGNNGNNGNNGKSCNSCNGNNGNYGNNGNNGSVNNNGNSGNNGNSNGSNVGSSNVGNHNQNGNGSSCANGNNGNNGKSCNSCNGNNGNYGNNGNNGSVNNNGNNGNNANGNNGNNGSSHGSNVGNHSQNGNYSNGHQDSCDCSCN